jgi:hypothetical protein
VSDRAHDSGNAIDRSADLQKPVSHLNLDRAFVPPVEAVSDPEFNLSQVATTTSNDSPLIIVSGPIAKQLDINAGSNALGRGWRANAMIGRALHRIINNIGGSWPGVNDMSTLGQPTEFANGRPHISKQEL